MKYYLDLLEELKQGKVAPVYLFYGPEEYLRRQAMAQIRERLIPPGARDLDYNQVDLSESSLDEVFSIARQYPFLSGRRLVVATNANLFASQGSRQEKGNKQQETSEPQQKSRPEEKQILDFLARPLENACIIFDLGAAADRRKKVYKEIALAGRVIEFSLLNPSDITRWLEKQARLAGKTIAPGASAGMISRIGRQLQPLSLEMQKLISYAGERKMITPGDVEILTPVSPEEDIFAVVDAMGERRPEKAIEGIRRLVRLKHPPPMILAMAARQFRLLIRVKENLGRKHGNLAADLGIHPFVAGKITAQQKNFSLDQLVRAMHSLQELDVAVKTGRGDFLSGMEIFVLDLCCSN